MQNTYTQWVREIKAIREEPECRERTKPGEERLLREEVTVANAVAESGKMRVKTSEFVILRSSAGQAPKE